MAKMIPTFFLLCVFLLVLSPPFSDATATKKKVLPRLDDIKYIKCDVCEEIVNHLIRQVKKKKEEVAPKKLTELQVIELTERICDVGRAEGDWIQRLDIVERGDKLKLVEQEASGVCGVECKTIEKACSQIIGNYDTDIAESLFSGESRSSISKLLCKDFSKSCVKKPPPVPKDRKPGEAFVIKDEKEIEMETMMRKLNDAPSFPGMPKMKMYSRDELLERGMGGMKKGEDEDEDEEEEEEEERAEEEKRKGEKGEEKMEEGIEKSNKERRVEKEKIKKDTKSTHAPKKETFSKSNFLNLLKQNLHLTSKSVFSKVQKKSRQALDRLSGQYSTLKNSIFKNRRRRDAKRDEL